MKLVAVRKPFIIKILFLIFIVVPSIGHAQNDTVPSRMFNILDIDVFSLSVNKKVKMLDVLQSNKSSQVNVVIAWAKWCPPCMKSVIQVATELESSDLHFVIVQVGTRISGDKYFLSQDDFRNYVSDKFSIALSKGVEFVTEDKSYSTRFAKEALVTDIPMHYFFVEDALLFWIAGYKDVEYIQNTVKSINLWEKQYLDNRISSLKFANGRDIYKYSYDIKTRLMNSTFTYRTSTMINRIEEFYPNGNTKTIKIKNMSTEKERVFQFDNLRVPVKAKNSN